MSVGPSRIEEQTKVCNRCKHTKSLSEFHSDASKRDGRRARCAACQRIAKAAQRYGLSGAELDNLQVTHSGSCAICRRRAALVIDHDHRTNRVRGLLCGNCNTGLGMFREETELLHAASIYLSVNSRSRHGVLLVN